MSIDKRESSLERDRRSVDDGGRRLRRDATRPTPGLGLKAFERRAYSQNGEDGIIEEILRRIGVTRKYCVEFGVADGRECNCARLIRAEGWTGLFLEADPIQFSSLQREYRAFKRVLCVQQVISSANIEDIFARHSVPVDFDVLSIDIDSNDYWVWAAIHNWSPRLVVIEYNASYPPPRKWRMRENRNHTWDGSSHFGASLASLSALGRKKGYRLVATDSHGVNAFFVRDDLASPKHFLLRGAKYHYSPPRYGPYCGGYPPRTATWLRWLGRAKQAIDAIARAVPPAETLILVDQNELDVGSEVRGRLCIPFLEHDGQYWGLPADDRVALEELAKSRQRGATFLVVAWPAFWCLDHYTELRRYLEASRCLMFKDRNVMIFDLRKVN